MQTKLERIGGSFRLLLPRELIEACDFGAEATVTIQNKTLVISPRLHRPREGWAEALSEIPQEQLDRDFTELQALRETPDEWDAREWQWPAPRAHAKV